MIFSHWRWWISIHNTWQYSQTWLPVQNTATKPLDLKHPAILSDLPGPPKNTIKKASCRVRQIIDLGKKENIIHQPQQLSHWRPQSSIVPRSVEVSREHQRSSESTSQLRSGLSTNTGSTVNLGTTVVPDAWCGSNNVMHTFGVSFFRRILHKVCKISDPTFEICSFFTRTKL